MKAGREERRGRLKWEAGEGERRFLDHLQDETGEKRLKNLAVRNGSLAHKRSPRTIHGKGGASGCKSSIVALIAELAGTVLSLRSGLGADTCSLLGGMFKRRDWSDYKMQTRPISESPVAKEEEERAEWRVKKSVDEMNVVWLDNAKLVSG